MLDKSHHLSPEPKAPLLHDITPIILWINTNLLVGFYTRCGVDSQRVLETTLSLSYICENGDKM